MNDRAQYFLEMVRETARATYTQRKRAVSTLNMRALLWAEQAYSRAHKATDDCTLMRADGDERKGR